MSMPIADVGPELTVALGACVVLVLALVLPRRRQGWLCGVTLGALAVAAWWTLDLAGPARLTFSSTWALDGLKTWGSLTVLSAAAAVVAASPRWFRTDPRHGEWYVLVSFSTLGALMLIGAADLIELLIGMLLVSVTAATLASFHRASRMSAEAGAKVFFLGALANPLLFLGIVFLYGAYGTTRYEVLAQMSGQMGALGDPWVMSVALSLVVLGLCFELGAVPMHPWVPDVAQGAPAPAAAFLTVVPKVGALLALARLATVVGLDASGLRILVAAISVVTMTLGNLAALWQSDLRRMLGWSSVAQTGYGLMAVVAWQRSELAFDALVVFVVAYAAANVAAFVAVVALRGRTNIEDHRGLARERPLTGAVLVVAMLSLTGIPPLVGFTAKLLLFSGTMEAGYTWLAVAAVVNTVVSLFYYLRFTAVMVLPAKPPSSPVALLGRVPVLVAALAAMATVVLGLVAGALLQPQGDPDRQLATSFAASTASAERDLVASRPVPE